MEHRMLIEGHGSIVAGIGRVSAFDHPWVRCPATADAPQRGGMRQHMLEPPLTQARMRWGEKPLTGAGLGAAGARGTTKDHRRGGT